MSIKYLFKQDFETEIKKDAKKLVLLIDSGLSLDFAFEAVQRGDKVNTDIFPIKEESNYTSYKIQPYDHNKENILQHRPQHR